MAEIPRNDDQTQELITALVVSAVVEEISEAIPRMCENCSTPKVAAMRLAGLVLEKELSIDEAQLAIAAKFTDCAGLFEQTIGMLDEQAITAPLCHYESKNT
jgi:hypothetical protein